MSSNPFDQAGRYLAKQDPVGFLAYALGLPVSAFRFRVWLDTRLLPFPGQADRTCDTVAHLEDLTRGGLPWAMILEFQIEPDALLFGRLLGYGGLVWVEKRPSEERGDRFCIGATVVNLRGHGNSSREMDWPEAGVGLGFKVKEVDVADRQAVATLAAIASGEIANVILPLIPLMQGGDRDDTIAEWAQLASAESDARWRGDIGGLTLVFAEAAGCWEVWKKALEGWNVIQSKQVLEWQSQTREEGEKKGRQEGRIEGRQEGRIEGRVDAVLELLAGRFGAVPEELRQALRAATDHAALKRLLLTAAQAASLEDFRQALPK